tara:strand:+ start:17 stop:832 length:816 start_codon:yes stop_codon:yes gene_type:complete
MRLNHNKKRNTAFLYEVLIKELSVATINKDTSRKNKVLQIVKEYFGRGKILNQELNIYKSFHGLSGLEEFTVNKILFEAKRQYMQLDRRRVYSAQSKLINEINKRFGRDSWNIFVANFKEIATINQILNQKLSPKDQVLLEEKLYSNCSQPKEDESDIKNIDSLSVKKFIERFNDEYTEKLNENQRSLLSKYISSYRDDGVEFKMFLYEEIDRLRELLVAGASKSSTEVSEKLNKIVDKIKNYSDRSIDKKMLTEIMKIQSLVSELKIDGN